MLYRKRSLSFALFALTYLTVSAQQGSDFEQKVSYSDFLYLNNIERESQNPTSILRNTLDVSDIQLNYNYGKGNFHAIDAAKTEKDFDFLLYGIKKINKIAFEGGIQYFNENQNDKKWNSTLFVAKDNPFILCDSINSNFSTEKFCLNGGFAYEINDRLNAGLRVNYLVGSSANQTDPRPETNGMKFQVNPGIDYSLGSSFKIGLSGVVGWINETTEYTVVKTYDNYQVLLLNGLSDPDTKQAPGYQRRYSGNHKGGQIQLTWRKDKTENFLEAGIQQSVEEAEDGGSAQKYKGGKYKSTVLNLNDRFTIRYGKTLHNFTFNGVFNKVEGVYYQQQQHSDANGNISWEVTDQSICHKRNDTDISLGYRWDLLSSTEVPTLTGGLTGGFRNQETNRFPEGYTQKYSTAYTKLFGAKRLYLKKMLITINANLEYSKRLSNKNKTEELTLESQYFTPTYEYESASQWASNVKIQAQHPIRLKSVLSYLGGYIEYGYSAYTGIFNSLKGESRQYFRAGINLIF